MAEAKSNANPGPGGVPRPESKPQAAPAAQPAPGAEATPAAKPKGRGAAARPIVLVVIAGIVAFFVWRHYTHHEGYTGGDVVTTGTIEAVHTQLGFKVAGRIAAV